MAERSASVPEVWLEPPDGASGWPSVWEMLEVATRWRVGTGRPARWRLWMAVRGEMLEVATRWRVGAGRPARWRLLGSCP